MERYPFLCIYQEFFRSLRLKNILLPVLIAKLLFLWVLFHYLYDNPYKASPRNAPSAIAEKLKLHPSLPTKEDYGSR